MYYVEIWGDGILHYQTDPNGKCIPVSSKRLNKKLFETETKYHEVCDELYIVKNDLHEIRLKLENILGIEEK